MSLPKPYGFYIANRSIMGAEEIEPGGEYEGGETSDVKVQVTGDVAYTGTSPTDPTGKLYLKVLLTGNTYGGWYDTNVSVEFRARENTPENGLYSDGYLLPMRLVFKLSNSEPSCALYGGNIDYEPVDHITYGTDLVLEAKEWWPYAKDSPAVPVWNSATGAKL